MAKKYITQLIDDLDNTVLEAGETIYFSLDGQAYEIDLSPANAEELRGALALYIAAGRPAPSASTGTATRNRSSAGSGRSDLAAVRAWARENNYSVSERGRIAALTLEAYDAAN